MMRSLALAAAFLCLAGCFLFDNPFDNPVTFQIVITSSAGYSGTYVWSSDLRAYETMIGGVPYYVYMDSFGYWCIADQLNLSYSTIGIPHSVGQYGALPPSASSEWTSSIDGIDDATGGITAYSKSPGSTVSIGDTLQVGFMPGGSATYQWQGSSVANGTSWVSLGTGSTYDIPSSHTLWIRVTITPTDSTGRTKGAPSISPPVRVS